MIDSNITCSKWAGYWREGVESEAARKRRKFFSLNSLLKIAENIMKNGRYRLIRRCLRLYISSLRNERILDIGCGLGRTTLLFRNIGLKNTIGIDWSIEGLKVCDKNGLKINKDVFLMDSQKTSFKDEYFKLVFSEGILEHFEDFSPLVKEMARISSKYIYVLQPNHFSLCGRLRILVLSSLLKGKDEAFPELSYKMDDFIEAFKKVGFELILKKNTLFTNYTVLLFEKVN